MKLISMTDFVLNINEQAGSGGHYDKIVRYAKFLKQPLTLGMFIPCDEGGKPLERPFNPRYLEPQEDLSQEDADFIYEKWGEYQKAKEKVLFEGFEFKELPDRISFFKEDRCIITYSFTKDDFLGNSPTIERVSGFEPTLTPNAIKQIGL